MPAYFDTGHGALRSSLCDPQAHASVVDQELTVRFEDREDFPMGQTQVCGIAWHWFQVQAHRCPCCQVHTAARHRANPQLWSLQIGQDPNRPLKDALNTADRLHIIGKGGVIGMTHIDAEDIDTRFA